MARAGKSETQASWAGDDGPVAPYRHEAPAAPRNIAKPPGVSAFRGPNWGQPCRKVREKSARKLRAGVDAIFRAHNGLLWATLAGPTLGRRLGSRVRGSARLSDLPGSVPARSRTRTKLLFSIPCYTYDMNTVASLPDYLLLSQTRQLARHEQALQILVLDHLCEIQTRQLYLTRGYGSLFDYSTIAYNYIYYNCLTVTLVSGYCFRNPLVVCDHPLIRSAWRRCGSATAAAHVPGQLARDSGHTVKTVNLEVTTMTPMLAACAAASTDYTNALGRSPRRRKDRPIIAAAVFKIIIGASERTAPLTPSNARMAHCRRRGHRQHRQRRSDNQGLARATRGTHRQPDAGRAPGSRGRRPSRTRAWTAAGWRLLRWRLAPGIGNAGPFTTDSVQNGGIRHTLLGGALGVAELLGATPVQLVFEPGEIILVWLQLPGQILQLSVQLAHSRTEFTVVFGPTGPLQFQKVCMHATRTDRGQSAGDDSDRLTQPASDVDGTGLAPCLSARDRAVATSPSHLP